MEEKKSINALLDSLFEYWKKKSIFENDSDYFVKDGIMNDESKWASKEKRIAFLVKEQNQKDGNWDDDTRNWMKEESMQKQKLPLFFHKIANLFYGLSNSSDEEYAQWWSGEIEQHADDVKAFFNTEPFALIECKKQPGGAESDDKVLSDYLNKYKFLLQEELEIIDPNIIVCMGGPIFGFVKNMYGVTEENRVAENNKNVYYVPEIKKVIVHAGHPSSRGSYDDHYEGAMYWYRDFLHSDAYKDFCK